MKHLLLFCALLISFTTAFSQQPDNKKLESFCKKFAKAVLTGKPEKCMKFFDKDYVTEQHDQFLKGNTLQFVSEYLLGGGILPPEEAGVDLPVFSDISDVKFITVMTDAEGNKTAVYEITLKKGCKYSMHAPIRIISEKEYGFYGAMG